MIEVEETNPKLCLACGSSIPSGYNRCANCGKWNNWKGTVFSLSQLVGAVLAVASMVSLIFATISYLNGPKAKLSTHYLQDGLEFSTINNGDGIGVITDTNIIMGWNFNYNYVFGDRPVFENKRENAEESILSVQQEGYLIGNQISSPAETLKKASLNSPMHLTILPQEARKFSLELLDSDIHLEKYVHIEELDEIQFETCRSHSTEKSLNAHEMVIEKQLKYCSVEFSYSSEKNRKYHLVVKIVLL